MYSGRRSLLLLAFALLLPTLWWDLGHRIVAQLAESRLTPHTREAVREILGGQSLADASVWADNIQELSA